MVFVIPTKRNSYTRFKHFLKYKDLEQTNLFSLQALKTKVGTKPTYRIVTRGSPVYELAHSNNLDELRSCEWKHAVEDIPQLIPIGLRKKDRIAWIVTHFTHLAVKYNYGNDENMYINLHNKDVSETCIENDGMPEENIDTRVYESAYSESGKEFIDINGETPIKEDFLNRRTNIINKYTINKDNTIPLYINNVNKNSSIELEKDTINLLYDYSFILHGKRAFFLLILISDSIILILHTLPIYVIIILSIVINIIILFITLIQTSYTLNIIAIPLWKINRYIPIYKDNEIFSNMLQYLQKINQSDINTNKISYPIDDIQTESTLKPTLEIISSELKSGLVTSEGISPGQTLRVSTDIPEPNTYSDPQGESWFVRCGPSYKKLKKKAPSHKSLFSLLALDAFQCERKVQPVFQYINKKLVQNLTPAPYVDLGSEFDRIRATASKIYSKQLPSYPSESLEDINIDFNQPVQSPIHLDAPNFHLGNMKEKFLFIINIQIPTTAPSLMGNNSNGPTLMLLWYLRATDETQRDLMRKKPQNPSVSLLKRICEADPNSRIGRDLLKNMKAIPRIVNSTPVDFGRIFNSLIIRYNGKPFLTKPQHTLYRGPGYVEFVLDVHNFCYTARKAINVFYPQLERLTIDWGFTLEATEDEDMPEVILGSMRAYKMSIGQFPSWKATLQNQEKCRSHMNNKSSKENTSTPSLVSSTASIYKIDDINHPNIENKISVTYEEYDNDRASNVSSIFSTVSYQESSCISKNISKYK